MREKKVVSRKVALGIGVLCIALLIILSGVVANYTSILSTVSSLKNQVASDNSEINSLNTTIASLQSQFPSLETEEALGRLDGFSVIQITDTQYLSDSTPYLFNGLTSWIVGNSQRFESYDGYSHRRHSAGRQFYG